MPKPIVIKVKGKSNSANTARDKTNYKPDYKKYRHFLPFSRFIISAALSDSSISRYTRW